MKKERLIIRKTKKGVSLVEAIIAVAVFSIVVSLVVGGIFSAHKYISFAGSKKKATMLAEEGLEATRNIRDVDFANLADGNHGLDRSGNSWNFSGSSDTTEGVFDRAIQISAIDENTKEIVSMVTWEDVFGSAQVSLSQRLTNWRAIASGWGNPRQRSCVDLSGGQDGIKVQIKGDYAFALQDSASTSLIVVDISDPDNISANNTVSLSATPYNIAISGDYIYVASSHNNEEMQDIDISDPTSPSKVGVYNATGNANAFGIDVSGNTTYLVRDSSNRDEFYTLNISNPNSPTTRDSINLGSDGNEVVKIGDYAYVATNDSGGELKVVDVSNSNSISLAGSYNISGNVTLNSVVGFDNKIFAGGENGILYIFDVTNPTSPVLNGQFDAEGVINDVTLGFENASVLLATESNSKEFQVINILDSGSPTLISSLDMDGNLNGVSYDENEDIAVTVGSSNTEGVCALSP